MKEIQVNQSRELASESSGTLRAAEADGQSCVAWLRTIRFTWPHALASAEVTIACTKDAPDSEVDATARAILRSCVDSRPTPSAAGSGSETPSRLS